MARISQSAEVNGSLSASWRLLRSRLGLRLLGLFGLCTVVPTCAVALLSFFTVTGQLTRQTRERLAALAAASGRTVFERLTFLDTDLRRQAPKILACARFRPVDQCGDELLYATDGIAIEPRFKLSPGKSAVLGREMPEPALYLGHRPANASVVLFAKIHSEYLWGAADAEGLPGGITFSLRDSDDGTMLGDRPGESVEQLTESWSFPRSPDLALPAWRATVSQPRAEVLAPLNDFTQSFPLLLAAALLAPVALSLVHLRRSLTPLAELGAATRRIAEGDFQTPVRVGSRDEFGDLATAFNTMRARLDRQFRALDTAADIDRAILSSMDTSTIVQTVLDRIPRISPCEAVSLTLFGGIESGSNPQRAEDQGTTWLATRDGARTTLPAPSIPHRLAETEWIVRGSEPGSQGPLPEYLAHLAGTNGASGVVCCPLRQAGELVGLLALRDGAAGRSTDILPYLRRLADQIAVALANARMIDEIRRLAFFDSPTGLPNRIHYQQRLGQLVRRARDEENGRAVVVGLINLDHFSRINDTLGHVLGDQLLRDVATRLALQCGQPASTTPNFGDLVHPLVARVGGDEFAVILPEPGSEGETRAAWSGLLAALRQPFRLGAEEVFVTASMGIARYPDDGQDPDAVNTNAGVALSYAKRGGGNRVERYVPAMAAVGRSRLRLEQELRRAVEREEFQLSYQPITDLRSGRTTGAEALVRWHHPERGRVPPSEFIGLCEDSGLIVPLGEWILREVCSQLAAWERSGLGRLRISVNLSARQLVQRGIVRTIQQVLEETGARPEALTIELTESLLMESGGPTERKLREIAALGIALAIDDFGTGYSSLHYLKHFPISTLKIDRSFIVDVTTRPDAAALTMAVIALGRAMELDVVAEGVETPAQAAFLRKQGCGKGQGYLYGYPMPAEEFVASLTGRRISA